MEAFVLLLLLGAGIYFTVKTRFVQVRRFGASLRAALPDSGGSKGGVSSFEAGCTALAATIGTGNITGVASAILLAGPGVLFWMWISAFLGMAVKYTEILLALRYRVREENGTYLGGPMISLSRQLGQPGRVLALLWCLLCLLSAICMGCFVQVSAVVGAVEALFSALSRPVPALFSLIAAGCIALAVGLSLLGGPKRVGRFAAFLVPVMSLAYLFFAGFIILKNRGNLPSALAAIVQGAFDPKALGFSFFYVAYTGLARGMFTHEAGLGTSSLAHAAAETKDPARQALFGVFEVFLDTIVICTVTGLAILTSGISLAPGQDPSGLVVAAFARILPAGFAAGFLSLSLLLFAFSSLLSFALYGDRCAAYLGGYPFAKGYLILFVCLILAAGYFSPEAAWQLSDLANILLALPNLWGLYLLTRGQEKLLKK
ncbi:MAG: sodium:alanine symporter family protein [Clostridia bacterium]|nr:sodium:alanine symporter family protein [Clostridia bacterium]